MTESARTIAHRYFAAFGAGDLNAALACIHDDAVWHIDGDPIVGAVGILKGKARIGDWLKAFPSWFEPLGFQLSKLLADDVDVVAFCRFRHRIPATGAIIDSDCAIRLTLRDGLIGRYQIFEDSLLLSQGFRDPSPARGCVVNGTNYGWDDIGAGPSVIFLHGLFLDRHFFAAQTKSLAKNSRCISFDMPGHGASGWRDGLDLDGVAEDIALWMDEQRVGPAILVGHSQGGMIAMRLAARRSDLVSGLVMINTTARAERPERLGEWRGVRLAITEGTAEARAAIYGAIQGRVTNGDWLERNPREAADELRRMGQNDPALIGQALDAAVIERADIRDLLALISAPTTVLAGELDLATPPAHGAEITAAIKGATVETIPRGSHHLPMDSPDIVGAAILAMRELRRHSK